MYVLYRSLTMLASPFIPLLLKRRLAKGKESKERVGERLGKASLVRPEGRLFWIHAASVGEANAVLPLIMALLAANTDIHILLTTVTVTSAALLEGKLSSRALHQFAPIDTPSAVGAFLDHWKPDIALWVDSEFWPNLIIETHKRGAVLGIINARLSERSANKWRYAKPFITYLFSCFTLCFAQSEADAGRLNMLGMGRINYIGNLKYDALPLAHDEQELAALRFRMDGRPLWLASSTHPGEEMIIARVHKALKAQFPDILTIIIPRHSRRGNAVAAELRAQDFRIAQRSPLQMIEPMTDIYLADTMGELGLFYRLAPIVFIGGTLVPHGGQNPLEAARLGCAMVLGPHMENFPDICADLERENACIRIHSEAELLQAVAGLLGDKASVEALSRKSLAHVQSHAGVMAHIMNELQPYLA